MGEQPMATTQVWAEHPQLFWWLWCQDPACGGPVLAPDAAVPATVLSQTAQQAHALGVACLVLIMHRNPITLFNSFLVSPPIRQACTKPSYSFFHNRTKW